MNTTKRNVVVSAVMAIVLCLSIVAGATFALFTSESSVNIAVTSGKVDVAASMALTEIYSPAAISESGITDARNAANEQTHTFANGGTATVTGGGQFNISKHHSRRQSNG